MTRRVRTIMAGGAGSLLILGSIAAGGATGAGSGTTLTIADKGFPESQIFAQLYAKALEAKGYDVTVKSLASSAIADAAIRKGDIDLYPEYTQTALRDILKRNFTGPPAREFALVKSLYAKRGLTALAPAPFNNGNEVACTTAAISKYKLTNLSALGRASADIRYAANQEHLTRPDGLPLLKSKYGFNPGKIVTVGINLRYQPIKQGQADCVYAFQTDPEVQKGNSLKLKILKDNKFFFEGNFRSFPVVSTNYYKSAPSSFAATVNRVTRLVSDGKVAGSLIAKVSNDKEDPDQVAEDFLKQKGVIS